MPIFIAALLGGLAQAAASLVGRVLIALSIGFIVYQGVDVAVEACKDLIFQHLGSTGATVTNILGMLNIDKAIEVVFSAISARLVLNGLTSGSIKKMVYK